MKTSLGTFLPCINLIYQPSIQQCGLERRRCRIAREKQCIVFALCSIVRIHKGSEGERNKIQISKGTALVLLFNFLTLYSLKYTSLLPVAVVKLVSNHIYFVFFIFVPCVSIVGGIKNPNNWYQNLVIFTDTHKIQVQTINKNLKSNRIFLFSG